MNGNPFKGFVFVFVMSLAFLSGAVKCFAQDDSQNQDTLNQVRDLAVKMQENGKRLDALEKEINEADTSNTVQEVPEQTIPSPAVPVPAQPAPKQVPVQEIPVETKSPSLDVLPQSPIYYAPINPLPKQYTFELAQEDFYSTFKETGSYEVYKKSGGFFGFYTAYNYQPWEVENWPVNVFHLDAHVGYGLQHYNYEGDKINDVNNYVAEPRAWVGKEFSLSAMASVTPYAGVGYRWYYDKLKNNTDDEGDGGFNIQTQYLYIPVGAVFSVRPADGWRIDMDSEYDFLVWGRVTNYLSNFSPLVSNVNNTLSSGFGLRGSIKIIKEGEMFNYFVEPYVRYWQIKDSKISDIDIAGLPSVPYQEDKNNTTEIGARIGVDF